MAEKMAEAVSRVINSNAFINTCLVGCFSVLGLRSLHQQDLIESLENENTRTSSTNKSLQNIIWDSKQKLYSDSPVVPLSRLKSIYGDILTPLPPSPDGAASKAGQPSPKIVI